MNALSAAVVGLGGVGLEYDYGASSPDVALTHSRAYALHERFALVAGVDPDRRQRERFTARYSAPGFESVSAMRAVLQPDVISVAVPPGALPDAFADVLACGPKAMLCEKPFAYSADAAATCVAAARDAECVLAINYIRRFDPGVRALKAELDKGTFGTICRGQVWYSKGLYNNGSHAIDLLRLLLGEVREVRILNAGRRIGADFEPDFMLRFESTDVWFLAHPHEHFSFGEIDLLGERGRIVYGSGGRDIRAWGVERSGMFPGYSVLSEAPCQVPSALARYQMHVLDALSSTMSHGAENPSDGDNAVRTLRVLDDIRTQLGNAN